MWYEFCYVDVPFIRNDWKFGYKTFFYLRHYTNYKDNVRLYNYQIIGK